MTDPLQPHMSSQFPGDTNEPLRLLQERLRGELLPWFYIVARDRYLDAVEVVGVETELAKRLVPLRPLELLPLAGLYDLIARRFRYELDPAGQLPLPFVAETYEAYAQEKWREWWFRRITELVEDEFITRAVLEAVVCDPAESEHMRQEAELLVRDREALRPRADSWDELEGDRVGW